MHAREATRGYSSHRTGQDTGSGLGSLVKALQAELGEERANALVREALGDVYRRLGEQWWRAKESTHVGENMALAFASWAKGDALDYGVRAQSQDTCEIDVTGCRYAQFYKQLGEPELGFLLICSADFTFTEGLGPDVKLTRTHHARRQPLRFSLQAAERLMVAFGLGLRGSLLHLLATVPGPRRESSAAQRLRQESGGRADVELSVVEGLGLTRIGLPLVRRTAVRHVGVASRWAANSQHFNR